MIIKKFDIVAFKVPQHHPLVYRMRITEEEPLKAISEAIKKGANVISIREVEWTKE